MVILCDNDSAHHCCAVTCHANFQMDRTALSIGGFTQPGVARNIIEQRNGAERGFSQRFLWIFPKPTFAKFASLKPVTENISISLGKHFLVNDTYTTIFIAFSTLYALVTLFASIWCGGDKLKVRQWTLHA